jgi:formylglycine-generating enzyme required for sulfatase activity
MRRRTVICLLMVSAVALALGLSESAGTASSQPARCSGIEVLVDNENRCLRPKDSFRDCPECPEMVVVPAGTFTMGSQPREEGRFDREGPQRQVTIARPFAVGKFEVTFAEWDACVSAGACAANKNPSDHGWGRGTRPAINVSWDDITTEYLPWLSRKTGRTYRLLTEAEWEYAARASSQAKYTWGDEIGTSRANCDGCGSLWDKKQSAPVGSFDTNAFGLHDMHGNVWEWVEDCWHGSYAGAPADGSASTTSCSETSRVLRGGSWNDSPLGLRSAHRIRIRPAVRIFNYGSGFRVGRTLNP